MRNRSCSFFYVLAGLALATQPLIGRSEEPGPSPTISEARPTPPQRPALKDAAKATVGFELYQGYLIVVHGSVGPLRNLNFFVDTGATPSILDSRIVRKLNLEDTPSASIVILGGRAQGGAATLPSLELGPIRRTNLQVATADLSFFEKRIPYRIDGIVGLDVLGQSAFVIDYTARIIRFGPPPALAVSLPLRLDRGLATVDAMVNDAPVHLMLDTGASSLVLFEKETMAADGGAMEDAAGRSDVQRSDVQRTNKDIGEYARKSMRLHTLRLGSEEFRAEPAQVVRNPKQGQLDFDGLMSPAALGITRISVDLVGGELAFSH